MAIKSAVTRYEPVSTGCIIGLRVIVASYQEALRLVLSWNGVPQMLLKSLHETMALGGSAIKSLRENWKRHRGPSDHQGPVGLTRQGWVRPYEDLACPACRGSAVGAALCVPSDPKYVVGQDWCRTYGARDRPSMSQPGDGLGSHGRPGQARLAVGPTGP
jgi:hypothetical protein